MGFLNIIALSYLSISSVVVFLHFFNRKSNIVYVPSFIPWKEIRTDVVTSRLFRINLLFLLQIFLIILLSLFLSRPYLSSDILTIHGHNKIVVLDTSASMQTIEKDGTRFGQAKEHILELIDKMKPADKMMIISAYSSSEVICSLTGDEERLRKSIENFMPTDAATDLEGGVSLALSYLENMDNRQLYIFTDQRIEDCGLKKDELDPESLHFYRFGASGNNVSISSFDTFQDLFKDTDAAYITVKNYSEKSKDVKLKIQLEQDVLMERNLALNKYEQKTLAVHNISLPGILKAEIETNDDLKADNVAFGVLKKREKLINIIIVTDSNNLKMEFKKLEKAFKRIKIKTIFISEYNPTILESYDISIFHKFVPQKPPSINSLFISPYIIDENKSELTAKEISKNEETAESVLYTEKENWRSFLIPKGTMQKVKIVDWDNTHPTMKYLDYLDNIKTDNALLYEPPKDARILINVLGEIFAKKPLILDKNLKNRLHLAFSSKLGNERIIVLGLDLGEFNYSDNNNLPILIMTLNMLQWLSPLGENLDSFGRTNLAINDQFKTGDLYPLYNYDNFKGLNIIGRDGTMLPVSDYAFSDKDTKPLMVIKKDSSGTKSGEPTAEMVPNYAMIKHAGIYVVKTDTRDETFVANFFDESESNIKPMDSDSINKDGKLKKLHIPNNMPIVTTKKQNEDISRYLLYLVPLLLFVEWIYSFVSKKQ